MSATTDQKIYRELRSERRWALAERAALWVVAGAVAIFVIGLVSAATVVLMDHTDGQSAAIAVDDE